MHIIRTMNTHVRCISNQQCSQQCGEIHHNHGHACFNKVIETVHVSVEDKYEQLRRDHRTANRSSTVALLLKSSQHLRHLQHPLAMTNNNSKSQGSSSSFTYKMTKRSCDQLLSSETIMYRVPVAHVVGHTTRGVALIGGASVRLAWTREASATGPALSGVFGVRVTCIDSNDHAFTVCIPGLACLLKATDGDSSSGGCCEIMLFGSGTSSGSGISVGRRTPPRNEKTVKQTRKRKTAASMMTVPMLSSVIATFPISMHVEVDVLCFANDISSIAHNAWLHDHVQRSLLNVHRWSGAVADGSTYMYSNLDSKI